MKQAFIFDMDGVLIDSEPLWQQSGIYILNQYNLPVTLDDMKMWTGIPAPTIVKNAAEKYHKKINQQQVTQDLLDYAIKLIIERRPLMPAVKETLTLLSEHNIVMAIASASPRYMLERIVENCGIAQYFSYISSACELEFNKPHPQVYFHACNKLKVDPHNAVGIEDSKVGMTAVKAASMSCIVIPAKAFFDQPYWTLADRKLHSLAEINSQLLAEL